MVETVSASEEKAEIVGYDVQAILPSNQISSENTFFDLRVSPEMNQQIFIQINNTSDEVSEFQISINPAYTNDQGFIDYTATSQDRTLDDQFDIRKLAEVESQVTIPAQTSQKIPIDLKMPSKEFKGQVLGGIQVVKILPESEKAQILNSYSYTVGLKLTESDEEVERKLVLESIQTSILHGKISLIAKLENPVRDALGHLVYNVKIIDVKSNEIIQSVTFDKNMQFAPMSIYPFLLELDQEKITAGEFILQLDIADAKNNEWRFDERFSLSNRQIASINPTIIDEIFQSKFSWSYIILGVGILVVGITLALKIRRGKK